jgi:hypothetical protein
MIERWQNYGAKTEFLQIARVRLGSGWPAKTWGCSNRDGPPNPKIEFGLFAG